MCVRVATVALLCNVSNLHKPFEIVMNILSFKRCREKCANITFWIYICLRPDVKQSFFSLSISLSLFSFFSFFSLFSLFSFFSLFYLTPYLPPSLTPFRSRNFLFVVSKIILKSKALHKGFNVILALIIYLHLNRSLAHSIILTPSRSHSLVSTFCVFFIANITMNENCQAEKLCER